MTARVHLLAALLGATAGCFTPPSPAVLFSCDPEGAAECPTGYSCEVDGCCHREGSDYEQHEGTCRLGLGDGPAATTTVGTTAEASTTSDAGTATDAIETTGSTGTSGSTGSSSSSSSGTSSSTSSSSTSSGDTTGSDVSGSTGMRETGTTQG